MGQRGPVLPTTTAPWKDLWKRFQNVVPRFHSKASPFLGCPSVRAWSNGSGLGKVSGILNGVEPTPEELDLR